VSARFAIELAGGGERLRACEPTRAQVAAAAPRLAAFYNDPHNRAMLAHAADLSVADVVAHYRRLAGDGARAFLLELDGRLVGDADIRGIDRGRGEVAMLVGERAQQGRGLGTRFGVMVHAFAFRALGLKRMYASIIPANAASLRLFAKLGYERDDSPAARRTIDAPDDVTLSLAAERFEGLHGALAAEALIAPRPRRPPPRP
jgi:RimJ/RimL family protein N-acetyltransferase